MATIGEKMTAVANAIRAKTGGTGKLTLDQMASSLNGIANRDSSSLTASGATVSVPAGNYKTAASKSVATATQATPSVSIDSAGKITATSTQTAGYVSGGTTTGTKQLTTQAAKTVTPSTSEQTAVASGVYTTGAVKVAAMPTATQATPSISVSSSGLITASATQSAGHVAAGTKSATKQLTVQAAKTITPSTSSQTAVSSGVYTTGAITVGAIPSTYQNVNTLTTQLYNSLQYSGFVTSSMSFSDICTALSNAYPRTQSFLKTAVTDWSIVPSMTQLTAPSVSITSSLISFKTFKMNTATGYVDFFSPAFTPKSGSTLKYVGNFSSEGQANYKGYIYIVTNNTYTKVATYGVANTSFSNSIDLSSYANKSCQIVIREESGWIRSNTDWTLMTFSTLEVTM